MHRVQSTVIQSYMGNTHTHARTTVHAMSRAVVTNPLAATYLRGTMDHPLSAAEKAAKRKTTKYAQVARQSGASFVPFSLEVYGVFEAKAVPSRHMGPHTLPTSGTGFWKISLAAYQSPSSVANGAPLCTRCLAT